MANQDTQDLTLPADVEGPLDYVAYSFGVSRRTFVQLLGAGLMIAVLPRSADAQRAGRGGRGGGGGGRPAGVAARVHIGKDGVITVLTGKVEMGQARGLNSRSRPRKNSVFRRIASS